MLVDKYVLVVTFIIFTSKTVQSFILLTANVADIKKIAQKFVSDDLADKLAHSVVKVIDNFNTKKGDLDDQINQLDFIKTTEKFKIENFERNDMFNNVKNKYNENKGDQQRFKKATRTPEEEYTFKDSRDEKQSTHRENRKKRTTKKYLNNWELNLKSQDTKKYTSQEEANKPLFTEIKSISHQERPKHFIEVRTTKKPEQYTIRTTRHSYHNYESNEVKSRYVPNLKPILGPRLIQKNKKLFENKPSSDRKRQKQRNRNKAISPIDDGDHDDEQYLYDNRKQPNKKKSQDSQEIRIATTRREKIEFDQYDNLNYPKMESYIATSGPVALPAMPIEKEWWEKEFPNRRNL